MPSIYIYIPEQQFSLRREERRHISSFWCMGASARFGASKKSKESTERSASVHPLMFVQITKHPYIICSLVTWCRVPWVFPSFLTTALGAWLNLAKQTLCLCHLHPTSSSVPQVLSVRLQRIPDNEIHTMATSLYVYAILMFFLLVRSLPFSL